MWQYQHHMQQQYQAAAVVAPVEKKQVEEQKVPYGKQLHAARTAFAKEIKAYFPQGYIAAACVQAFRELCRLRAATTLPEDAAWFEYDKTFFKDEHEKYFKDFLRTSLVLH